MFCCGCCVASDPVLVIWAWLYMLCWLCACGCAAFCGPFCGDVESLASVIILCLNIPMLPVIPANADAIFPVGAFVVKAGAPFIERWHLSLSFPPFLTPFTGTGLYHFSTISFAGKSLIFNLRRLIGSSADPLSSSLRKIVSVSLSTLSTGK